MRVVGVAKPGPAGTGIPVIVPTTQPVGRRPCPPEISRSKGKPWSVESCRICVWLQLSCWIIETTGVCWGFS